VSFPTKLITSTEYTPQLIFTPRYPKGRGLRDPFIQLDGEVFPSVLMGLEARRDMVASMMDSRDDSSCSQESFNGFWRWQLCDFV
jgi:hypothetical protein